MAPHPQKPTEPPNTDRRGGVRRDQAPTFFPRNPERRGWVPIGPMVATTTTTSSRTDNGYEEHTKKMLPLRLSWAWTIWKAQGQTIRNKMVVYLSDKEKELGITYLALSRATKLEDIAIGGPFTQDRLMQKSRDTGGCRCDCVKRVV